MEQTTHLPAFVHRAEVRSRLHPHLEETFADKGPLRPNLARELLKDSSAAAWQSGVANIVARVGHEIARMLPR